MASVLGSVYFYKNVKRAEERALLDIENLKAEMPPLPDPGSDLFDEAVDLLREEEFEAARSKAFYILKYYEDSSRYIDAKRIIGEMNLDRLLSSDPMEGKIDYTVRRGDSLALIASRNQSTVSYIMRSNNLTSTRIHPGEELLVSTLDFTVVLHLEDRHLTLTRDDQFFKEYDIERVRLPRGASPPFSTSISDKLAYLGERRIPIADSRFQATEKWLHTKVPGLVLGAFSEENLSVEEASMYVGVDLAGPDLEELFTILRVSTPVKVLP
ncbi:MAG: LysM peptidoglycan-binding domain-containing protein [Verrucomicrobiales bacterium]